MKTPIKKLMLAMAATFAILLGATADGTHDKVQLWEGGPYWATTNIGADEPEDYGYYFWWGDTVGYRREGNAWVAVDGSNNNFSFSDSTTLTWNKDNTTLLSEGYIDLTGNLVAAHDAATAHWGASWRMPTSDEFAALISNCTITWITTNGVNGRLVTGKDAYADKSIFLPAAGYGNGTGIASPGNDCNHYSSSPDSSNSYRALFLGSNSSNYQQISYYRYIGMPVRPVWQPAQQIDLSTLTADYTAQDGDVLTGTTSYNVSISDGATVTLYNANIVRTSGPAISCVGNAIIILDDKTENVTTGQPGVRLPSDTSKTLIIKVPDGGDGSGALIATGLWGGAGIGNQYDGGQTGNLRIIGGNITAAGGSGAAGIGSGNGGGNTYSKVGDITISGGTVTATGAWGCSAIGSSSGGRCVGSVVIEDGVQKVVANVTSDGAKDRIIASYSGNVEIASSLRQTYSNNGFTLTIEPDIKYVITWLDYDGTEIDATNVNSNAVPVHVEPTKEVAAPYRWVFTGWTPELEPAVSNTTYTATFRKIADMSLLTGDWQAENGDAIVLTNVTDYAVTIPAGASVTINGVTVKGASGGGGAAVDAPSFSDSGESAVTKFVQVSDNTWTVTAFAEMEGDSIGSAVSEGMIKVYAADSVEELKTAEPLASGVEVEEKKSAVKTKINVTLPSTPEKQFFKVEFGE